MRIWLNDFELNNPAKRVYIYDQILGLDLPGIRTSKGRNSGQAGGYFGAQLFDTRAITINGTVFSNDVYEAKQRRREIQAALPLYPEQIAVRIEDDDGGQYLLYAQLIDFDMPVERSPLQSRFKLELEAASPVIYDTSAGSGLSASIYKAIPGGLQFTTTSPQFDGNLSFYFSAGQTNSSVENTGKIATFPIIVIPGVITNPSLTNRTTGDVFYMQGYGVGSDSVTQIDMQQRTVRLGSVSDLVDGQLPPGVGGSVFGYVAQDASWWGLAPGINEIIFDSTGGGDVSEAAVRWLPALMGI